MTSNLPIGFSDLSTPYEIESGLVFSLLMDGARVRLLNHIRPEMIGDPILSRLWSIMTWLVDEGRALTPEIISAQIDPAGDLAKVLSTDGRTFRDWIFDAASIYRPDDELFGLAEIIVDRWKRRHGIEAVKDAHHWLNDFESGESADAVLTRASNRLTEVAASSGTGKSTDVGDICAQIAEGQAPFETIKTGYGLLDQAMAGGLACPGVTVFEARPKNFKTGFMLSIAYQLAMRGERSAFVSLEMPSDQLLLRLIAAEDRCKIPASEKQIRAGFKKRGQFKSPKLEEALKILLREEALEGAHDAMTDVLGCMRLFDWLQENMGTSS